MLALHAPILESRRLTWSDEAACAAFAATLAARLAAQPGGVDAVIELHGPLGAGKTTFARHLLRALGVQGRIKSPTYAVLETYPVDTPTGPLTVSHFDFYRFEDPREWEDAGFREPFTEPGLKLVEWPERARDVLPVPDLRLTLEPLDDHRREVTVDACTPRGAALMR